MTNPEYPARAAGTTDSAAHHAPDGSFRNPWPDGELPGWGAALRFLRERRKNARTKTPARNSFPVSTPRIHWGTFRLTDEPMDEPPRRAAVRWGACCLDADRLWVARFGETRLIPAR
jgi:hypothetical protein